MDICVLSIEEGLAYELYGLVPCHHNHRHTDMVKALCLVREDLARTVGGDEYPELAAVMPQVSNDRVWRGRSSQGHQVMQLVRRVQGRGA